MDRLTKYSNETSHKNGVCCTHFLSDECRALGGECAHGCKWEEAAWERLAAYEDTGRTPEEVTALGKLFDYALEESKTLTEQLALLNRIRDLAKADRAGRLVVRPYSIGETVYVLLKDGAIFYPETNGWYISEEIIEAISHDGFYLGDPVDDVYTPDSEIGKTVFLTREGAEKALEAKRDGSTSM